MSFLSGCFLFIDGTVAFFFFLVFHLIGLDTIAFIGAAIIAIPIWIWLIKFAIEDEKKSKIEAERERRNQVIKRKRQREIERINTICSFQEGITKLEFETMARRVSKRIKRLQIDVDAPIIYCKVESQSGISTWKFTVDFNDFGHITGSWWITRRDNHDSSIPNRYADLMKEAIEDKLKTYDKENYTAVLQ